MMAPAGTQAPPHPLDPLGVAELAAAVAAIRDSGKVGPGARFWGVTLDEDHARRTGGRRARTVVLDPGAHQAYEVDIELGEPATAVAWRALDPRNPGMTSEEARTAAAACREDPRFRAVLAKRGITDLSLVMVDPESIGGFEPPEYAGRRLTWGSVWLKTSPEDNHYARPVQGVVPIIDMERMEVLRVEDHGETPLASEPGDFTAAAHPPRAGLTPLDVVQPEGPSFSVHGNEVRWQNWSFRIGFTHREGLVLHDLAYAQRPVVRRAAVNEMYVPYFDTSSTQYRKNFFDWGEYGGGPLTNSLELGCDCLGVIHYFDATVLGGDGVPRSIPNAICMHEEDDGILWKHHDGRRGTTEVRRSRRLIVSSFVTVANYDYGFYWSLHQDGSVDLEIKMTGILSATGIGDDEDPPYARKVAPNVAVTNHQHYFAVRLDMAVDGPLNRLAEVFAAPEEDPALDPYGNACRTGVRPVRSEREAGLSTDPVRSLHWRVESAERVNRMGEPTAYRLFVDSTARLPVREDSVCARRAPFVGRQLWATAYDPDRRFVGGEYPNQAEPGSDGVQVWQREDRSLDPAELVLWATVGSHHFPRPEDWPVMPVAKARLRLEPDGFFDRNPALDVPPPSASCHPSDHCH
ncbi:primary-amine oxidase [Amycolatopsis sp. K13G38]|uniref:Amine oxidase n=1 Tax=Amycolatopsis acididurans TaxID=2724524 RepID=A0ABX1IZ07_9PSEU|nr:primary-amine oxidase [Amycolatopsis acididurans]NKQ51340.1 primary-amine oxidase [Amycolatopsis acididurans]